MTAPSKCCKVKESVRRPRRLCALFEMPLPLCPSLVQNHRSLLLLLRFRRLAWPTRNASSKKHASWPSATANVCPTFICLQVTRRYVDPSGLEFFRLADTVAARLSYFEQKEDYKVVSINGNLANVEYDRLGGATSSGEFGTMLRELFEPNTQAEFWWERWATLRGRRMLVFGYKVAQPNSKWHLIYDKRLDIVPGYHGLIFIDRDVPVVMRLTLEATDIPASFPIQEAKSLMDYDYTSIAEKEFLLPLRAEVRMREGKFLVKNQVEFRSYRKFGAEATITFETPDPLSDDKIKEKPPQE